ncbi:MAG: SemiSWEET family transporter [Methanolinea sp.]|nr:SemiSWEET family transporter [Methanolinea sp.]
MDAWFLVGVTAALLTTFGFVPQVAKMYRTRSVHDVSPGTFVQFAVGVSLWTLYGYHLGDPIIVAANVVTLATLAVAIGLYVSIAQRGGGEGGKGPCP